MLKFVIEPNKIFGSFVFDDRESDEEEEDEEA